MKIGIIGGSILRQVSDLQVTEQKIVNTRFGAPSSPVICGKWAGKEVVLIFRHGEKHTISPSKINYRANILALKEEGVKYIISTSASGSLREDIAPGHFVVPSQFIDRTTKRESTFYDKDQVCHVAMAEPFCPQMSNLLIQAAKAKNITCHAEKTLVTIEGPRFSTRAESILFRQWGCDVINMTTVPEVTLAREAEMCYAVINSATDYDAFLQDRFVTWDEIVRSMATSAEQLLKILAEAIQRMTEWDCTCQHSLKNALV
jgi:5'-methylthioadenosine phosphorylase